MTKTSSESLYDFQLPDGTRLGDATREQLKAASKHLLEVGAKMQKRTEAIEDGSALCLVAQNAKEEAWLKTAVSLSPEDPPLRDDDGRLFVAIAPEELGELVTSALRDGLASKDIGRMIRKVGRVAVRPKMTKKKKVPLSEQELLQRINQKLAPNLEEVKQSRGHYNRWSISPSGPTLMMERDINLERVGRELDVLAEWEVVR